MIIKSHNVLPNPMKDESFSSESLWTHDVCIDTQKRYFLKSASGKGKSTFCGILLGLRHDYTGVLSIDDKDIKSFNLDQWADLRSKKFAFLAQDMKLFPNLTVIENLQIKNKLTNFTEEKQIDFQLDRIGLLHKKKQLAGQLSLGQQQRVALIRSTLQPFEFMILDEPFSHIDQENIKIAVSIINEASASQNSGLLLTSLGYDYDLHIDETLYL